MNSRNRNALKIAGLTAVIMLFGSLRTANAQGPPGQDSADAGYQCMDTDGYCGTAGCNSPCAVINVRNDSYNYQIVDVTISCSDPNSNGMTICSDFDDNGISWPASCALGTCITSDCDFRAPGTGLHQTKFFHIEECGCCKVTVTVQWNDPSNTIETYVVDFCGKCP